MTYLDNIFYLIPEIFLSLSIVFLLGYGAICTKWGNLKEQGDKLRHDGFIPKGDFGCGGKARLVSELKNITYLSILAIFITIWLVGLTKSAPRSLTDLVQDDKFSIDIGNGILGIDNYSIIIKSICLLTGALILLMSLSIYEKKDEKLIDYEYSQLILMSILGMLLLISSRDLILMYLSIETLSLSLYVLAAIRRSGQYSTEAGLKYFILGALSSGLLLFGSSLIYIITGLTEFESISNYIWLSETSEIGLSLGAAFIIMALLFKLAAAPFHMWAPDVYEGASTIVTAFFAIVPKIAVLSLLITLIYGPFLGIFENLIQPIIIISGLMSILVGSIAAINQTKIKRLLAYSAIAHMGWILIGLGVGTLMSIQATLIYIVLYILMSINSFAFVISYFKGYGNNYITQLSGLSRKEPILAITFSLCLLSIAGIPPLAGFYSKYNILLALIDEKFIITSILGIVLSVIGSFYYIRIIQWMYFNNSSDYIIKDLGDIVYKQTDTGVNSTIGLNQSLILGSSLFFILTYLIYPNPLVILTFDGISNLIY